MPNDPHRDALAAALARVEALQEENRELREGTRPATQAVAPVVVDDATEHAIDNTLRELSQRLDQHTGPPAPRIDPGEPEPRTTQRASTPCASCKGTRTVDARLSRKALTVSVGIEELRVAHARVCADCGHLSFGLDERSRLWLDANYLTALLAEND
jgi:hypothetical protein